jgi:hypothetical protein
MCEKRILVEGDWRERGSEVDLKLRHDGRRVYMLKISTLTSNKLLKGLMQLLELLS